MQMVRTDYYRTASCCASGACVEVAALTGGRVAVRDSKDRSKPPHVFTQDEWDAFVAGVKAGEFDQARLTTTPQQHC
jgi:hypothetical protein